MRTKVLTFIVVLAVLTSLAAQQVDKGQKFQPAVGQAGKDVIWVPTPEELVAAMLDAAHVTPNDYVIDLGSGDGRIVIAAAKRGARALGIEYNPDMVALSRQNAAEAGVADKATFREADIFATDFSQATVITMYLLPDLNYRLRPKILELKPGTRVVSHSFDMKDWEPDQTVSFEYRTAYLWIVPANVAGTWASSAAGGNAELILNQTFQKIDGSLKIGGRDLPIKNAKLDGDKVSFTVDETPPMTREYAGRVNGDVITGTVRVPAGPPVAWSANRPKSR
jgi:SAM-dependent methyltransferase